MSSSIWTRCEGRSSLRRLRGDAWRVVEDQYLFSTRKLVASDAEQRVLEELLEASKPGNAARGLHYLLLTPFRYPPLTHGSRFRTRADPGVWYGARQQRAAFAEAAYYRLLFLEGTAAAIDSLEVGLSAFRAAFDTARGVDLTRPPFAAHRAAISSPVTYADSQPLGRALRDAGVDACLYDSAREPDGVNVALFTPRAFAARKPSAPESWRCVATRRFVEVVKKDVFRRLTHRFERAQFEVDGTLPSPGI
jgi:RES domain-containing protein